MTHRAGPWWAALPPSQVLCQRTCELCQEPPDLHDGRGKSTTCGVRDRSPWSPGTAAPSVVGLPMPLGGAERATGLPLPWSRTHRCSLQWVSRQRSAGGLQPQLGAPVGRSSLCPWVHHSPPAARLAHLPPRAPAYPAPPPCSHACLSICLHGVSWGPSGAVGRGWCLHPSEQTRGLERPPCPGCLTWSAFLALVSGER